MAVSFAWGNRFSSSPAFRPPPQPISRISFGLSAVRTDMPQSASLLWPEFIPPTMSLPRKPSGFRV